VFANSDDELAAALRISNQEARARRSNRGSASRDLLMCPNGDDDNSGEREDKTAKKGAKRTEKPPQEDKSGAKKSKPAKTGKKKTAGKQSAPNAKSKEAVSESLSSGGGGVGGGYDVDDDPFEDGMAVEEEDEEEEEEGEVFQFRMQHILGSRQLSPAQWRDVCDPMCKQCPVLSCLVLSCLVYPVLSCVVLSCVVLSCVVFCCLVVSCQVLSCVVISCLAISLSVHYAILCIVICLCPPSPPLPFSSPLLVPRANHTLLVLFICFVFVALHCFYVYSSLEQAHKR
jgi:hypothetical protein